MRACRVVALCIVDPRPKGRGSHRAARPAACIRAERARASGSPSIVGAILRAAQNGWAEKAGMPQNPRTTDGGACTSLGLIQLAVPVQEVAPAFVQVAGREAAAVLLQFLRRRLRRIALQQQAGLTQELIS